MAPLVTTYSTEEGSVREIPIPLSPMLFILVMDVLNWIVTRASEDGLLQPLSRKPIQHRISLYADDVALFLQPTAADINLTLNILQLSGDASGLKTNLQKSNVLPIQFSEENMALIQNLLPCEILDFPSTYLGLPLSLRKLTREQFQPIIDRIADHRAGRVVQVQFVLTAMLVYLAMATNLPPWAIKAIDKTKRAWPKVCREQCLK